jgi:hypothetical protein
MRSISRKWRNIEVMPDGVALHVVEDACATLHDALVDLGPVITLTWPPSRQPSLGTDGGQPYTAEFQSQLLRMGDVERKWYLKQHEFTTSVQRYVRPCLPRVPPPLTHHFHPHTTRNLTRLALLAQRVREDPDAAYRNNVYERISQFAAKFQDIALRLKVRNYSYRRRRARLQC